MTNIQNLTLAQLRKVVGIKEKIEQLEAELASIAGGAAPAATPRPYRRRRNISAAGRAAIAAAQRVRWAEFKARGGKAAKVATKKKRKVDAATRVKLALAAKARWAKVKAAGKSAL